MRPQNIKMWAYKGHNFFDFLPITYFGIEEGLSPTHIFGRKNMGDEDKKYISNFRFINRPLHPWEVSEGDLSATVESTRTLSDYPRQWQLHVSLDIPGKTWRLLDASSPSKETKGPTVISDISPEKGPRKLSLEFATPRWCSIENPREHIILQVRYEVEGRIKTANLKLDYRCLLGDSVGKGSHEAAEGSAHLAEKYRSDPAIKRLVSYALEFSRKSPRAELERLKRLLTKEGGYHYTWAPQNGLTHPSLLFYSLSPTETLRFGGNCAPWAILAGAYLSSLGFETYIASNYFHVWVVVRETLPKQYPCPKGGPTVKQCGLETPRFKETIIDFTGDDNDARDLGRTMARIRPTYPLL